MNLAVYSYGELSVETKAAKRYVSYKASRFSFQCNVDSSVETLRLKVFFFVVRLATVTKNCFFRPNRFFIWVTLVARRTKTKLICYREGPTSQDRACTCDLNAQLGLASLRLGDRRAIERRLNVRNHCTAQGLTHPIPDLSGVEGTRLDGVVASSM